MDSLSTDAAIDSNHLPLITNGLHDSEAQSRQPQLTDPTLGFSQNAFREPSNEAGYISFMSPISSSFAQCPEPQPLYSSLKYQSSNGQSQSYNELQVPINASCLPDSTRSKTQVPSSTSMLNGLRFEVPVSQWTPSHVATWMRAVGLEELSSLFADVHRIDGPTLLSLTERDLRRPPLALRRLGDIKRVVQRIASLRGDCTRTLYYSSAAIIDQPQSPIT